jgi:hypothetical protein
MEKRRNPELNHVSQSNLASKLEVAKSENESRLNFRSNHTEAIHEPLKNTIKYTHLSVPTALWFSNHQKLEEKIGSNQGEFRKDILRTLNYTVAKVTLQNSTRTEQAEWPAPRMP